MPENKETLEFNVTVTIDTKDFPQDYYKEDLDEWKTIIKDRLEGNIIALKKAIPENTSGRPISFSVTIKE